jgi:hypothetical protein
MRTVFRPFALLAFLIPCLCARAQMGPQEAGPYGLPLTQSTLLRYCDRLGFDADQRSAARALHEAYRAAFNETAKQAKEKSDGLSGPEEAALVDSYITEIRGLERQLLADVQSLCTSAQAAHFASIERARRRDLGSYLAFGAGDGIDLVSLLESHRIARPGGMEEILARWEEDIDRVEVERDRLVRGAIRDMVGGAHDEQHLTRVQSFVTDLMKLSFRNRDITRRTVREMEAHLDPAQITVLQREIRERSFPRIWGKSDVEKAMDHALGLSDLTAEQSQKLDELKDRYLREAGPINTRWAAAAENKQAQMADNFMAIMMEDEEGSQDAFYTARAERRALDQKTDEQLRASLTEEQRERLPKPEPRTWEPPEFAPDFDRLERDWEEWEGDED